MKYIYLFSDEECSNHQLVGGKAASLAYLYKNNIKPPLGFVISTKANKEFFDQNKLTNSIEAKLKGVDFDDLENLSKISESLKEMVTTSKIDRKLESEILSTFDSLKMEAVAVRSSAAAEDGKESSWAGQLLTLLYVNKNNLITAVKKAWASMFEPNVLSYVQENGLEQIIGTMGVIIMPMIKADTAGVAFSVNPVNQDQSEMLIEACFGLGEILVSGQITPESYIVNKENLVLKTHTKSRQELMLTANANQSGTQKIDVPDPNKEKMSKKDLLTLTQEVKKLENLYGFPIDIEWAFEKGELFILQSRPITTLGHTKKSMQYQFSWEELHSFISAASWLNGYINHKDIIANEFKDVVLDVNKGIVSTYNSIEEVKNAEVKVSPSVGHPDFLSKHLKTSSAHRTSFRALLGKVEKLNLAKVSNERLLKVFREYQDHYDKTWALFKVSQPEYLESAHQELLDLIKQHFPNDKAESAFITLTTTSEKDIIKKEELAAYSQSLQGKTSIDDLKAYSKQFPWLFFNTYDEEVVLRFLSKKFAELKGQSRSTKENHIKEVNKKLEEHDKKIKALLDVIPKKNRQRTEYLSDLFRKLAVDRLELKAWWGGAEYLFLDLFKTIAEKARLPIRTFMLTYSTSDIDNLLSIDKRLPEKLIKSRQNHYALRLNGNSIEVLDHKNAKDFIDKKGLNSLSHFDPSQAIKGISANSGVVRGTARVVPTEDLNRLIHDMERFQEGEILITTMTQPTMLSLARKAAAIVADEGGITSHASILAREFGIPCVVGTHVASKIIQDGDLIEVNGDNGSVFVV